MRSIFVAVQRIELDEDHEVRDEGGHESAQHVVVHDKESVRTEFHVGHHRMDPNTQLA